MFTLHDNHRLSPQWFYYNESLKHTPKQKFHHTKFMVNVWWSAAGAIYYNILNSGKIIAAEKYYSEIEKIRWNFRKNQPMMINRKEQICFVIMPDSRFDIGRYRNRTISAPELYLIYPTDQTCRRLFTFSSSTCTATCRGNM